MPVVTSKDEHSVEFPFLLLVFADRDGARAEFKGSLAERVEIEIQVASVALFPVTAQESPICVGVGV